MVVGYIPIKSPWNQQQMAEIKQTTEVPRSWRPLHRGGESEDPTWDCPGKRVEIQVPNLVNRYIVINSD